MWWWIRHHIWWWILWSTKFGDEFGDDFDTKFGDEFGDKFGDGVMYNLGDEYCESQNLAMNKFGDVPGDEFGDSPNRLMNLSPNLVMTFVIYTKLSLLTSKYFPKNSLL